MSFLLHEFNIYLGSSGSAKLKPDEQEIYRQAKEELMGLISGFEGTELVKNVYRTMDHLLEQNLGRYPVVCGPGCAHCCNQMVCCTNLEMDLIAEYLNVSKSRERRLVKAKAIKRSKKYHSLMGHSGLTTALFWEHISSEIRQMLYKRPCPFLRHNKCGIYPVRPPDCRSARVLEKRCGYGLTKPLKKITFYLDQIVADVLMEEDMRLRNGQPQVVPLFGWILSPDFKKFFS